MRRRRVSISGADVAVVGDCRGKVPEGWPMRRRRVTGAGAGVAVGGGGAFRSSAHAFRWFIMGTCASQQSTEQKAYPVRFRLQVDTLQT